MRDCTARAKSISSGRVVTGRVVSRRVGAGGGCPERKGAATRVASPFSSPATPLSRAAPPPAPQGPMHESRLGLVGSFRFAPWQTLRETQATIRQQTRGRYWFCLHGPRARRFDDASDTCGRGSHRRTRFTLESARGCVHVAVCNQGCEVCVTALHVQNQLVRVVS